MTQKVITPEMEKKYLADPTKCPFCGSSNIHASDHTGSSCDVDCDDCHSKWYEIFKMIAIGLIE